MFEYLKPFPKVLVTGPQRSGGTIVAAMIANDLGYRLHLEERVRVSELWRMEKQFATGRLPFVLQAPALCRHAHEVSAPDVAVVLVRRDIDDIIASERRVNWESEAQELRRYGLKSGVISEVKYRFWDEYQKPLIENAFEVNYEDLAEHPMWIPKEERVNFGPRQYRHT